MKQILSATLNPKRKVTERRHHQPLITVPWPLKTQTSVRVNQSTFFFIIHFGQILCVVSEPFHILCFHSLCNYRPLANSSSIQIWYTLKHGLNFVHVVKRKYCTICRKRQANKEGISFVTVFTAVLVFPVLLIQEKVCWKRYSHFQERPDHTHAFFSFICYSSLSYAGVGAGAYPDCHWVRVHPVLVTGSAQGVLPDCARARSWSLWVLKVVWSHVSSCPQSTLSLTRLWKVDIGG